MSTYLLKSSNIFVIAANDAARAKGFSFILGLRLIEVDEDNKPTDKVRNISALITTTGYSSFKRFIDSSLSKTGTFSESLINYVKVDSKANKSHLISIDKPQPNSYYYCFETGSLKQFEEAPKAKHQEETQNTENLLKPVDLDDLV